MSIIRVLRFMATADTFTSLLIPSSELQLRTLKSALEKLVSQGPSIVYIEALWSWRQLSLLTELECLVLFRTFKWSGSCVLFIPYLSSIHLPLVMLLTGIDPCDLKSLPSIVKLFRENLKETNGYKNNW